ncbi:TIGR03936 family radical SAM-associated protein [Frankia sp. Ag45/Mut15]|uniref:TIGR03936 family radical SAM-associated protein n=1 Tax=Frankia umida TaxID=573489 RepID=A0ABT0JYJ7_9ACTN|nr:TIGR03936 family radical SAM-associated protein [Frankia umida]MCK9876369.1 TIGR03936 family radical SAM-associated protein [Frankia umida]
MARRPEGPPPPPVVARVRLRFAKRGRLRFLSHRDVARTFERGLRRAEVPMAYSAGFSPHPRISWVGAAPTGAASEAEYVELALAVVVEPDRVRAALDAALPPGLDVLDAVQAASGASGAGGAAGSGAAGSGAGGSGSLADRIDASRWRIRLPTLGEPALSAAVAELLRRDEVQVERATKDGRRRFDARGAVVLAVCRAENDTCAILELVARHTTPAVRPDDVLTALYVVAGLRPSAPPEPTRLEQGRLLDDGTLADPLAPDRNDAGRLVGRSSV